HLDQLPEADTGLPAELRPRPRRVADKVVDLGWAQELRIDRDVALGVEPDVPEGGADELLHRVRVSRGDDEVLRLLLLEHQPHRLDIVTGEAPVALRLQVPEP